MKFDLHTAQWRKSTRSGGQGDCVEVALNLPGLVGLRDSKDPHGADLVFTDSAWHAFVNGLTNGELTRA